MGKCLSISSDDAHVTKKSDEDQMNKNKHGYSDDEVDINPPTQDEEFQNSSSGMEMHGHSTSVYGSHWVLRRDVNRLKEQMEYLRRDFDHLS